MATPYIGEIKMFGGNFVINGWAYCNGATLPIAQNEVLYTLIGTTYGGDGVQTFNLPNLQSRFPLGQGQGAGLTNRVIGQVGGEENVTLTALQIPIHVHVAACSASAGTETAPAGNFWAANGNTAITPYSSTVAGALAMNSASVSTAGGNQPHQNLSPFLTINFIIALEGVFPSRS